MLENPAVRKAAMERVESGAIPMRRLALPQEIADAAVWLCGGRASFVTGTALFVDGGYSQRRG